MQRKVSCCILEGLKWTLRIRTISMANGCTINYVKHCVHLSTIIHSDKTRKNMDSAVNELFFLYPQ